jgi:hypothetical protein
VVNAVAGPFLIQFKLLAGMLSLLAIVVYGLGIFRLLQAAKEVRRERPANEPPGR